MDGEHCTELLSLLPVSESLHRENRTHDIDAHIAEGKIPVDVDLSQHPEKSVESRACMSPMLLSAQGS